MSHRHRFLGVVVVVCVAAATAAFSAVGASPAGASTNTKSAKTFVFGSTSFNDLALTETSLADVDVSAGALDGAIDWLQTTTLSTQYDTDDVRRGEAVDPTTGVTRTAAGFMTVNWSLPAVAVRWPGYGTFDVGDLQFGAFGACDLRFGGAAYVCHLESASTTLLDSTPDPGPYANATLAADLTITPQALATLRTASYAGTPGGTANLALGETGATDPLSIACTVGVGTHLSYALGSLSTTPGISVQANLALEVGTSTANPAYPATDPEHPVLYGTPFATPSFPFASATGSVTLTGNSNGTTFDLGAVQENSAAAAVADAGGPYSGTEGSPIAFDGSGSTAGSCGGGTPTLHWDFSDGGSADGAHPHHTFADDGTYTGTLTATSGGESTSTNFSVEVDNALPSVDTGANATAKWGHPVAFAGTASDDGTVDATSLEYSWAFGDGSPTVVGADASHTYATPGGYDATLTVCDKDDGCDTDVRHITVTKHDTSVTYTGELDAGPNKSVAVSAVLVDEDGMPLAGRRVDFQLGDVSSSATTGANGVAATTLQLSQKVQKKGAYPLTATFTPNSSDATRYVGSSDQVVFKQQVK